MNMETVFTHAVVRVKANHANVEAAGIGAAILLKLAAIFTRCRGNDNKDRETNATVSLISTLPPSRCEGGVPVLLLTKNMHRAVLCPSAAAKN